MATGTSSTMSSPVFHGNDPEQTTEYRTISALAIASLVLGLLSLISVVAVFLIVIPLTGIALSLLALRRIAVSGGLLAGRWAATVGLALSVASALFPISHDLVRRYERVNQAEKFGRSWVAMVTAGKLDQAFRLTADATRGRPPAEPGAPPAPKPEEVFRDQPIIKSLQAAGENAAIRVRDTVDYQLTTYRNMTIRQLYEVTPAASAAADKPFEFILSVQRTMLPRSSMSQWIVTRYDASKPADGSAPNL